MYTLGFEKENLAKDYNIYIFHGTDGDDWDTAFTAYADQNFVTDSTQDNLDVYTWSRTYAQLGITSGDHVRMKMGRTPASVNELVGDYAFKNLRITLPRT